MGGCSFFHLHYSTFNNDVQALDFITLKPLFYFFLLLYTNFFALRALEILKTLGFRTTVLLPRVFAGFKVIESSVQARDSITLKPLYNKRTAATCCPFRRRYFVFLLGVAKKLYNVLGGFTICIISSVSQKVCTNFTKIAITFCAFLPHLPFLSSFLLNPNQQRTRSFFAISTFYF